MVDGTRDNKAEDIIQGLWIGSELSVMEQLSINSFLAHGHDFHLYTYADVRNVPDGTSIRDGEDILPSSAIFRYQGNGSYAGFSNFFRYELLLKCGGWWADLDTICLQPFCFDTDYVIGAEPVAEGGAHPISGVMKSLPGSELMRYLTHVCRSKDTKKIRWGETGPRLVAAGVERLSLQAFVQPYDVFCPVGWYESERLLDPTAAITFGPQTRAIHLWNEVWSRNGQDKNAEFSPDCLYERLKARYR